MREIVLASASPRRYELLKQVGLNFKVCPADIIENMLQGITAEELVKGLSHEKAIHVAKKLGSGYLVIGADTVVMKDSILGKPENEKQAFDMLKLLQGKWHEVLTGITVVDSSNLKYVSCFEKTKVKMRMLDDYTIEAYIRTGEPMDKAGAYGIQGIGALIIERIEGCYFNVVGLPLTKLCSVLGGFGIKVL